MEDGLELSLGLSYGGSSSKSKIKDVPSDPSVDEGSSSRLAGSNINASDVSLKNFFESGIENQGKETKQKNDQNSHQGESFLTNLVKCSAPTADGSNNACNNLSQFSRYQDLWISNNKTAEIEEEKSVLNKRKLPFEERNLQKKLDKTVDYVDPHGKNATGIASVRNSHVSVNTEDGSFGENEDVAESETEGSNSWLVSQREASSRCSDDPKYTDKHVVAEPSSQGQKQPHSGNESNLEHGKVAHGIPLPLQPLTVMPVPYPVPAKVPNAVTAPNTANFPSPFVMQLMPPANNERTVVQTMSTGNLQLAFGYSPVQLPTLETNSSWAFSLQPPPMSSTASKDRVDGAPNLELSESDAKSHAASIQLPHNSAMALAYERDSSNLVKISGKQMGEAGTSATRTENEDNGKTTIFMPKEAANRPVVEGFSSEGSIIRPGIASNLKFGGCGSYPDLPWVSTTGPGPNGKTISGVTYKYSKTQIKIVCACHGFHMSPEEFVQHASAGGPNIETNTNLA